MTQGEADKALEALFRTPAGLRALSHFVRVWAAGIPSDGDLTDVLEAGSLLRFASRIDTEAEQKERMN